MKTDDLIRLLAADTPVREPLGPAIAVAVAIGVAASAVLLVFGIHTRPDVVALLATPRVAFKIVLTLGLAIVAVALVERIGRPGVPLAAAERRLLMPLAAIVAAVALELALTPATTWEARLVGRNAGWCLLFIPMLAAVPLAALLTAMRRAAPANPTLAGAVAGLAAAAIAAALYAWHCPDDSPLFVATWYTLAGSLPTAIGALVGRRLLVW